MSKRKVDEIYAEKSSDGGGTRDAKAPETSGWSGLPPELVRRVGQLQDEPKSLAVMERTCKSWRNVIMEGDNGVDIGDTPCLWRDLALAKFPRLTPLVEAVRARSTADSKHSWKALYRVNADAHRLSRLGEETESYQPKTSWNDYFLTVEFRRGDTLLFVASGEGDRTSPLWCQNVDYGDSGGIICKGPLDPNLKSNAKPGPDPFFVENLRNITARVLITRLSDLSVVELGELGFNEDNDVRSSGGDLLWGGHDYNEGLLPIGISSVSDSDKPFHIWSSSKRMKLWITPADGEVILHLDERCGDGWYVSETSEELAYLEMQCPWPQT